MDLTGLVAVSGKSGLFKLIGQSKAGFILQPVEEGGSRVVVNTNARLAALDETTVYGVEKDIPLKNILLAMQSSAQGGKAVPDVKDSSEQHRLYFLEIAPDHDTDRVYGSDLKKIVSWYKLLEKLPLFEQEAGTDSKSQ